MKQIVARLTGTIAIERTLAYSMRKVRGLQLTVVGAEPEYSKLQRGRTTSSHQPFLATLSLPVPARPLSPLHHPQPQYKYCSPVGEAEVSGQDLTRPLLFLKHSHRHYCPSLSLGCKATTHPTDPVVSIWKVLPLPQNIFQAAAGPGVPQRLG